MEKNNQSSNYDPLGLEKINTILGKLNSLEQTTDFNTHPDIKTSLLQLENAFLDSRVKYDYLKDRYQLLKQTTAALSNELAWLRDQLDDLHQE